MEIIEFDDQKRGLLKAVEDNKEAGALVYVWDDNHRIIIEHTEVKKDFSGRGVGKLLVSEAVKLARTKGAKILPLCTFAKHIFEQTEEYKDVLSTTN